MSFHSTSHLPLRAVVLSGALGLWLLTACGDDGGSSAGADAGSDVADTSADSPVQDVADEDASNGEVVLSPEGDFELLEGWNFTSSGDYEGSLDFTETRSGAGGSRHVTSSREAPFGTGGWGLALPADDFIGRRIQFRTFLKLENVTGAATAQIQVRADTGELLSAARAEPFLTGSTDWTEMTVTLDVDDEADTVTFSAGMGGTGEIWFDDSIIVDAPGETPSRNVFPPAPINLDFEAGLGPVGFPDGWSRVGDSGPETHSAGLNTTDAYEGEACGELTSTVDESLFVGFGQFIRAIDYQGETLRWRARVSTDSVEGWAGLWMRVDGVDYETVAFDNMIDRQINGTTDWTEYEVVLPVADDAWQIAFGVLLSNGAGSLLVDDGHLEVVEQ